MEKGPIRRHGRTRVNGHFLYYALADGITALPLTEFAARANES
jgi:hypothetical protein